MTPEREFCLWLRGYLDAFDGSSVIVVEHAERIKRKLEDALLPVARPAAVYPPGVRETGPISVGAVRRHFGADREHVRDALDYLTYGVQPLPREEDALRGPDLLDRETQRKQREAEVDRALSTRYAGDPCLCGDSTRPGHPVFPQWCEEGRKRQAGGLALSQQASEPSYAKGSR